MKEKKKSVKVPHTYVLIFMIIVAAAILTYIIPAGKYEMVEKTMLDGSTRKVVDPATFAYIEQQPVKPFSILKAIPQGMKEASSIVFFIFILGGSFQIVNATGAILSGITNLALRFKGKGAVMIPLIVFLFSIGGGTIGMAEEAILFVPIGIVLARSLGYDAIVGMAMVALGAAAGFTSGFMNPFTVGVAQGIAELPIYSGIKMRLAIWVASNLLVSWYILRYAKRVKGDLKNSYVYDLEMSKKEEAIDLSKVEKMTSRQILVLIAFFCAIGLIVYGVITYEWYMTEIAAVFLGLGIVAGFIGKISVNDMAKTFIEGAKDIATGALVVGIARGILVVLTEGAILDTIVHSMAGIISALPHTISAVAMFLVQSLINFIIPSGSGQASTTMPIMTPLADVIGLTRQTAVLAFNLGDGISNSIIPTSGTLLANLAIAKIDYEKWVKFVAPLMVMWTVMACVFMAIAAMIHLGPF
ncbi:MAG: AbgT family transporter [Peptostreptococcaceae bacterium]|nr:AbgT family transporter [Peptostreptococcaceae bacterium]